LDEVQRCPGLFNYLQRIIDEDQRNGLYILTGSSQFQLNKQISQSLAGRVGNLSLLPFSIAELKTGRKFNKSIDHNLFHGFYPRILAKGSTPRRWLNAYIETYIEKDIRQLMEIKNRDSFLRFISLCAGNVGALLNLSRIAADCSITVPTAKSWLSVLQASYICFTLQPHSSNFRKRIVKTPKLYFYDVGLACRLLGIQEESQINTHPLRGSLFENMVVTDLLKTRLNQGIDPSMFFWRDSAGLEIDLILENGNQLQPIEIKLGETFTASWLNNLNKWCSLAANSTQPMLCYGGSWTGQRSEVKVLPWHEVVQMNIRP
jgi:predicted AAA+ superfamily ATPase